jgi:hypothetical protein
VALRPGLSQESRAHQGNNKGKNKRKPEDSRPLTPLPQRPRRREWGRTAVVPQPIEPPSACIVEDRGCTVTAPVEQEKGRKKKPRQMETVVESRGLTDEGADVGPASRFGMHRVRGARKPTPTTPSRYRPFFLRHWQQSMSIPEVVDWIQRTPANYRRVLEFRWNRGLIGGAGPRRTAVNYGACVSPPTTRATAGGK